MDAALLNPSKYIKAIDFNGRDVMLTIAGVKLTELVREDNTKENRGTVSFRETAKSWVLNVTNVKALVTMWGRETDDWIGKRVVLYPEPSDMSESGFAIRVRGSPDIEKSITFTLKLARKKPREITLKAFKNDGKQAARTARPAQNGNGSPAVSLSPSMKEEAARAGDGEHLDEPPAGVGSELEPLPGGQQL